MERMKFFSFSKLLLFFTLIIQISTRVYVPHIVQKTPQMDFMTRFSDNFNNDLLTNTLSMGINDSNKTYKDAGLSLQNKIINKEEMDTEGRKLVQEYNSALDKTQQVDKEAQNEGFTQEHGNWGNQIPEERQLTQIMVPQQSQPVMVPQQSQPIMVQRPQYFYNQIPSGNQPMYTVNQAMPVQNVVNPSLNFSPTPGLIPAQSIAMQSVLTPTSNAQNNIVSEDNKTNDINNTDKDIKKSDEDDNILAWAKKSKKNGRKLKKNKKKVKKNKKKSKKNKKLKSRHLRRRFRRPRRRSHGRRPPPHRHNPHNHNPQFNHYHHIHDKGRRHITHQDRDKMNWHKLFYGHEYVHNRHNVRTKSFVLHNKAYYENRYHPYWNRYYKYYLKVRKPNNMNLKKNQFNARLRKAKLAQLNREKFDNKREKMVKSAAEKWNRTFIYDSVLMVERMLYEKHKKILMESMKRSAELEAQSTKDIDEFYNKYFEKLFL